MPSQVPAPRPGRRVPGPGPRRRGPAGPGAVCGASGLTTTLPRPSGEAALGPRGPRWTPRGPGPGRRPSRAPLLSPRLWPGGVRPTLNAGGGRRSGRSRPSRAPGVYRFQGSAESLPWGLGEGWQLGSRRTPELSRLGWGVVSVGRKPAGTCPPPGYSTLTFPSRLSARSPAASFVETPVLTTQRPFPTQL